MRSAGTSRISIAITLLAGLIGVTIGGCGLLGGLGILPMGTVTGAQLVDEPNYTVALSVDAALTNPLLVGKINWVFGDGTGFVEGPSGVTAIKHRYDATGTYQVTAFVFSADGLVGQISGSVRVAANPDGTPAPDPTGLPGAMTGPNPKDKAQNVSVTTKLTWTGGTGATSHDVYLGTTEADVDAATNADLAGIFTGNQTATQYEPAGLLPDSDYFWRVDERNANGATKGPILSFHTAKAPEQAKDFQPANEVGGVPVAQVLRWTAGKDAASHDVYFGKDQTQVINATHDDADVFKGNQTGTTFDPNDPDAEIAGQLLPTTTYYWRIDEVGLGGSTAGDVLKFTTKAAPPKISTSVPANNATDVDVGQSLSWSAAATIESFDVYFGDDEAAVTAAKRISPEFKGNQTSKIFVPSDLAGGTVYFWRVDTLNAGGTTKGDVLHFTTAASPGQTTNPSPAHTATGIAGLTILSWQTGAGGVTTSFNIYFGTDSTAVSNGAASALQGGQDVSQTQFDPLGLDTLLADTLYYWRIDAVGPGGVTAGSVWRFRTASLAGPVSGPIPANNQRGVPLSQVLQWTDGLGAGSYDVYLGTTQTNVQNATHSDAEFKANVAATSFTPSSLDANKDYFWRIDAMSLGGTRKGTVWKFTTAPAKATDPQPLNADTGIGINTQLSWTAGAGAASHDVYFGTNPAFVTAAIKNPPSPEFKGNQTTTNYSPPADLDGFTTYYWRIDEINVDGTTKGDVWSFTTAPGEAAQPIQPLNGATGVALEPTLMWTAAAGAVSHDVYLGTNQTTVGQATTASAEFKTNQAGTSWTPVSPLTGNTAYYWRIDEVDAADHVTKGAVWQFHTATGPARDPLPATLEAEIPPDTNLAWTAGSGATSHRVYLGTNQAAVDAATTSTPGIYRGEQTGTTYSPPDLLDGMTTYYWRIDSVGSAGIAKGTIWQFMTSVGQASEPITPTNGATGVALEPTLTWTPATGAVLHAVYLGTNGTTVANATLASPEFQASQAGTSFTPAAPLQGNTTYFWRIDEIDANNKFAPGHVWQFHTATGQARDPLPATLETDVEVTASLSWTAGSGATSHRVFLGTNQAAVDAATTSTPVIYKGEQVSTTYAPIDPLSGSTAYFWRIDEVGSAGVTKGSTWQFTTRLSQATTPDPANGVTGVDLTPLLTWTPAAGAASHDVYFGASASVVDSATRSSIEYQGGGAGTNFSPGVLNGLTWYYWRIDEVDAADNVTKGALWQFRTGPGKATNPVPANFAVDIALVTLLQWSAGIGAVQHRVFLGTSLAAVTSATTADPEYKGSHGSPFDPSPLAANTTYYWRIDEVAANGTTVTTGDVWRFTTLAAPAQVTGPNPFNGATAIAVTITLNWSASATAASYNVYLSTVQADVIAGVPAAFQTNTTGTSFNPTPDPLASTTYYWRIDAVNAAGTTAGAVWSFKTAP